MSTQVRNTRTCVLFSRQKCWFAMAGYFLCICVFYISDLFYTRVAPSKTFDLLKEDFDYYLITVVLFALVMASYITKKLASKKALKQAWK
ncbi:hypothetical protein PR048_032411 [Dryococelus australis]|uniref:ER membrane protein complex subunit 1 n=1 Tax=Dryococelus australis TaxID=614101 RepID=A0ABQ9G3A5_9NEOP|nr:hypothetical protein PR048_032411 [Dryococelus australis]